MSATHGCWCNAVRLPAQCRNCGEAVFYSGETPSRPSNRLPTPRPRVSAYCAKKKAVVVDMAKALRAGSGLVGQTCEVVG